MKGRRLLALSESHFWTLLLAAGPAQAAWGWRPLATTLSGLSLSLSHLRSLLLLLLLFFACQMSAPAETLGFCSGTECIHTVHSKRVCLLLYRLEIFYIWKGRHRTIREEKRSANFLLCRKGDFKYVLMCVCVCLVHNLNSL